MKASTRASILARYADALEGTDTRGVAAGLRTISRELNASGEQSVRGVLGKRDAKSSLARIAGLPEVASAVRELALELNGLLDFVGEQKETGSGCDSAPGRAP